MKAFLGFLQVGLGIAGVVALFKGEWLALALCWIGAWLVGLVGNRLVGMKEGISQGGRESIAVLDEAIQLLRSGRYVAAEGHVRSAVTQFKLGGDKELLTMGLVVLAVAQGANGKFDAAKKSAAEAKSRLRNPSSGFYGTREADEILAILTALERELRGSSPNVDPIVRALLDFEEDLPV